MEKMEANLALWKSLISSCTTQEQLSNILALIESRYDESLVTDEDDKAHRHITVRHLRCAVERRKGYLQRHSLEIMDNLLTDYIRRQKKDFGWYLDASQKCLDLFRHLNGKGGDK